MVESGVPPARSGRNAVVAGSLAQLGTTKPNTDQYSVVWIGAVIHVDSFSLFFPPNLLCSAFGLCIWLCPSTHLHAASKIQTKTTRKYFCIRNFLVC